MKETLVLLDALFAVLYLRNIYIYSLLVEKYRNLHSNVPQSENVITRLKSENVISRLKSKIVITRLKSANVISRLKSENVISRLKSENVISRLKSVERLSNFTDSAMDKGQSEF